MFIVTLVQPDRQPHRLVICNTFAEAEQQARAAGAVSGPTRLGNHDTLVYALDDQPGHAIWIERV
jgi:hypothetical protein